jgi:nucleoside-diphosphate-sugar epimerase
MNNSLYKNYFIQSWNSLYFQALVHVSTAYCNCDREQVGEVIYPPPYDPEKIIQCVDWMDEDLVNVITPNLIGKRPNTYTFTKALAEHMLLKESGNLPVAIVRPSIGNEMEITTYYYSIAPLQLRSLPLLNAHLNSATDL